MLTHQSGMLTGNLPVGDHNIARIHAPDDQLLLDQPALAIHTPSLGNKKRVICVQILHQVVFASIILAMSL
jgi:hypothetical protein